MIGGHRPLLGVLLVLAAAAGGGGPAVAHKLGSQLGVQTAQDADRVRAADSAAPVLPVRVGDHEKYLRIVFDWTKAVDYTVAETGGTVAVRFARPARIDADALRKALPDGVSTVNATADATSLVVTLPKLPGSGVRHFKVGEKVVLDFVRGAGKAPAAKAAAPSPARAPQAAKPIQPAQPQQVAEAPQPPKAAPSAQPAAVETPKPAPPVASAAKPQKPEKEPVKTAANEPPPPKAAPVPQVKGEHLGTSEGEPAEAVPTGAEAGPQAAMGNAAFMEGSPQDAAAAKAKPARTGKAVSLVFEWPELVGAAVFRRRPYVWVVFDKRAQLNLASLREAGDEVIDMIEQLPVGTGTVVRMVPKAGLNPHVELEGTNWVIRFQHSAMAPHVPIALRIQPEAASGTQLELPVSELGKIIRIPDPEVGDMITAVTLKAPGHGVAGPRRYPEFGLLASAQGVGFVKYSDDIEIRDAGDRGIAVVTPGGLHISSISQSAEKGSDFLGPRVFNLANWIQDPKEPFIPARQAMFEKVLAAPEKRRDDARLDLARFYFARGFGPEALGVIRTIEYANEDMASQPEIRALKAATLVYMGRPFEARKALMDPSLDQYKEIALWRGSMFQQSGDMKKAAAYFRSGEPALQSYPDPIRTKLAIELAEASLADLDVSTAAIWLDQLGGSLDKMPRGDAARVRYDQGVLARDSRKLDEAVNLWKEVKKGSDQWQKARAEFALIELGLQQETVTPDEAIDRLDRLRFQWRGDELELHVLRQLGQLYLDKNDYRKGLSTLRTAVTYYPDGEQVKEIAKLMSDSFRKLHLEGVADSLPPLKALALYDDFRELTPAGPEGDLMIQRLADRLVAVDLLDRAASLLSHQVRYRLKGEDRARVGAKLALVMLLDRNPKGALAALRNSFQPNLPYELEDDRRRIRAKATMELGRYEDAVALLAGDVSREADLLRANIYWTTKDYAEAAKVLQRLAGDPLEEGAYPEEQARYILSWAVALRLKRDEAGVKMLRDLYGPGMSRSKLADAFAYISSPVEESAHGIEEMSKRIAETDKFDAFLKNYRDRLISVPATAMKKEGEGTSPTAPANAAGAAVPPAAPAPAAQPDTGAIPPPPPAPQG